MEEVPYRKILSTNYRNLAFLLVITTIPTAVIGWLMRDIAFLAGNPHLSRVVGYALHVNPDPEHIKCYRVVNRFGEVSPAFAFGGKNAQIDLLRAEGVTCYTPRAFIASCA